MSRSTSATSAAAADPGQIVYPDSPIGRINQPFNGEGGTIRAWS